MSNLFTSQPKIKVGQNSVSFVSQNGLEYSPGQKIVVEIDDSVQFFDPQQSFLKFDVEIDLNSATHNYLCQLDPLLGGSVLLEDVKCFNRAGVLLEEYPNYYTWANVDTLYSETDTSINKDGLTEGVVAHNPQQKSWAGGKYTRFTNSQFNPYFRKDATGNVSYNKVRICLKLKTGIMKSKTIFPNRLMGGLKFEFILSPPERVMKLMKNAIETDYCPRLSHVNAEAKYTGFTNAVGTATKLYLSWHNSMMSDIDRVPFCVGEKIKLEGIATSSTITSIEIEGVGGENFILLNISNMVNGGPDIASGATVKSSSYDENTQKPTYKVSGVEFIVEEILTTPAYQNAMMSALKENGKVAYNCICSQNYRHSVLASDLNATVHFNLNNSMAKAINIVPVVDQTATIDVNIKQFEGFRNGISGYWDINNYQFMYENRMQPDRVVSTVKTADQTSEIYDGVFLCELEKGIIMAGIPSNSFEHIKHNAVISRAFALEGQVYDTRGKDAQINLEVDNARAKSKLLNCWVTHVRRFEITNSGVNVIF